MKDPLGCNWFKRRCTASASFYCSLFFFSSPWHLFFFFLSFSPLLSLSRRFQYTQIMADVNELNERKGRERMWITPSPIPLVLSFWSARFCLIRENVQNSVLLLGRLETTVKFKGARKSLSVACERDYCAPQSSLLYLLLRITQRLRMTRTYQVISGQADVKLCSYCPPHYNSVRPFSFCCLCLSVSHDHISISLFSVLASSLRLLSTRMGPWRFVLKVGCVPRLTPLTTDLQDQDIH